MRPKHDEVFRAKSCMRAAAGVSRWVVFFLVSHFFCGTSWAMDLNALLKLAPVGSSLPTVALTHHSLEVVLHPTQHSLQAKDRIHFPVSGGVRRMRIHEGLQPRIVSSGASLKFVELRDLGELKVEFFDLVLGNGVSQVEIVYSGRIHHPLHPPTSEAERGITETPGLISSEGVSLFEETHWYPQFEGDSFVTFDLTVEAPVGWSAVSQGDRTRVVRGDVSSGALSLSRWEAYEPQGEIHLNAAVFHETTTLLTVSEPISEPILGSTSEPILGPHRPIEIMTFLRSNDAALAKKYSDASERYLRLFISLLGDYPYGKFALVENFWDTGYGMPSFTLIGTNILRLPFIVNTSFPHEILHCWWGNGVYVKASGGNWSEGLTSYLADHLLSEQAGAGVAYRRDTLDQFSSAVTSSNDFPLAQFRFRFDRVSSAIGYGKSLMFFHMLRTQLGDELFLRGLRRFYRDRKFTEASFQDLRQAFEAERAGLNLKSDFQQWVNEKGAPQLTVVSADAIENAGQSSLKLHLVQTQSPGSQSNSSGLIEPFSLRIPVAVHLEGFKDAFQTILEWSPTDGFERTYKIDLPGKPHRVDVDPEFDVFRRLSPGEVPPSFARAYGAGDVVALLPSGASADLQLAYQRLAESVRKNRAAGRFEVRLDSEFSSLDELSDAAIVWVLGWQNRFALDMQQMVKEFDVEIKGSQVDLRGRTFSRNEHAFAFVGGANAQVKQVRVWAALDSVEASAAAPVFGAKLPHYGKFGFAAFEISAVAGSGSASTSAALTVTQRASGQWPTIHSPLSVEVRQPDGTRLKLPSGRLQPREWLRPPLAMKQ